MLLPCQILHSFYNFDSQIIFIYNNTRHKYKIGLFGLEHISDSSINQSASKL